jgi:hypothetical protein
MHSLRGCVQNMSENLTLLILTISALSTLFFAQSREFMRQLVRTIEELQKTRKAFRNSGDGPASFTPRRQIRRRALLKKTVADRLADRAQSQGKSEPGNLQSIPSGKKRREVGRVELASLAASLLGLAATVTSLVVRLRSSNTHSDQERRG